MSARGAARTADGSAPPRPQAKDISGGGVEKDVAFVAADDEVNDAIDHAYRMKYRRHSDSYVTPMVAAQARATTLKLVPRDRGCRS
jgi:hypothetical protein